MKEIFILLFQKINILIVISILLISYGLSRYKKRINRSKLIETDTNISLVGTDTTSAKCSSIKTDHEVSVVSKYGGMPGRIMRIGLTGCFIKCDQPLAMDEQCVIVFTDTHDKRIISIESRVLWSNAYLRNRYHIRIGMTVQFLHLDIHKRQFLTHLMDNNFKRQMSDNQVDFQTLYDRTDGDREAVSLKQKRVSGAP